MKAKIIEV